MSSPITTRDHTPWRPRSVALYVLLLASTTTASGHELEETRRLVLSVHADRVELLVAYELRAGELADGLRAQFDRQGDDRLDRFERLARAQVVTPRLGRGVRLEVDGVPQPLWIRELVFPPAPREGGRLGVAALALFVAPVTADEVRLSADGGRVSVEAQAAPSIALDAGLPRREGDPVLGPKELTPGDIVTLVVRRLAPTR